MDYDENYCGSFVIEPMCYVGAVNDPFIIILSF